MGSQVNGELALLGVELDVGLTSEFQVAAVWYVTRPTCPSGLLIICLYSLAGVSNSRTPFA